MVSVQAVATQQFAVPGGCSRPSLQGMHCASIGAGLMGTDTRIHVHLRVESTKSLGSGNSGLSEPLHGLH